MGYSKIDPVLEHLAKNEGIEIFFDNGISRRRFFYVSLDALKVVQIVIEPEKDECCRIDLHAIEGGSDNFHLVITDAIENIEYLLSLSIKIANMYLNYIDTSANT